MADPHDLQRFVEAQASVVDTVRAELRAGNKRTHWMWFIFPQIAGLGHSAMARRYAISGRDEALAFVAHPVLGPRLLELSEIVLNVAGRSIHGIFGSPDDMKFRSSMTLFAAVAPEHEVFQACLERYFAGEADKMTLDRL